MARTAIDRRGNRRYRARYQGPDQRWRSRTFDRRIDAQRWLTNELAKLDRGDWVDPRAGRVPVELVAERWMAGRMALRESTRARDRSYLDSLVLPYLGRKPLSSIQPSDLEAWVSDLLAAGKAPATIQKAWQVASGIFRLAVRDRLIALSPARDVRLPKIERSEPIAFTVEEVMRLADAIDPRYRGLVLLGASGSCASVNSPASSWATSTPSATWSASVAPPPTCGARSSSDRRRLRRASEPSRCPARSRRRWSTTSPGWTRWGRRRGSSPLLGAGRSVALRGSGASGSRHSPPPPSTHPSGPTRSVAHRWRSSLPKVSIRK